MKIVWQEKFMLDVNPQVLLDLSLVKSGLGCAHPVMLLTLSTLRHLRYLIDHFENREKQRGPNLQILY